MSRILKVVASASEHECSESEGFRRVRRLLEVGSRK